MTRKATYSFSLQLLTTDKSNEIGILGEVSTAFITLILFEVLFKYLIVQNKIKFNNIP